MGRPILRDRFPVFLPESAWLVLQFFVPGSMSFTLKLTLILPRISSIYIRQYIIHRSQYAQQIPDRVSFAYVSDHLHMRKGWRSHADAIRRSISVTDRVVAVRALGGFDGTHCLAWWDYGSPTHTKEVGNQRFNVVHGELLHRWRCKGVICLVAAFGHAVEALTNDAKALPHCLDANQRPIVAITIRGNSDVEIELIIS